MYFLKVRLITKSPASLSETLYSHFRINEVWLVLSDYMQLNYSHSLLTTSMQEYGLEINSEVN